MENTCQARRDNSGAWRCQACGLQWDADDDAPPCNPVQHKFPENPAMQSMWKQQGVHKRKLAELRAKKARGL